MWTLAKFRIPLPSLPPPNEDGNHLFRFRIASEDKTRVSAYSNLYIVKASGQVYPDISQVIGQNYKVTKTAGGALTIAWEMPTTYNSGASAQLDYIRSQPIQDLIVTSSISNVDVSGIVPNIYKYEQIVGNIYRYRFFNPVTRVDANKVIGKLLLRPGVISAQISEPSATTSQKLHDEKTKWGILDVDIFVKYFISASAAASAPYVYYGRTKESQISLLLGNTGSARMIAQVASYPPKVNDKFKLFDTGNVSLA